MVLSNDCPWSSVISMDWAKAMGGECTAGVPVHVYQCRLLCEAPLISIKDRQGVLGRCAAFNHITF